jgi:opacity protein-like surface antigen
MTKTFARFTAVALMTLSLPAAASAQTFLTPYAGVANGGDAQGSPLTYGASLMFVSQIGFEFDASYSPDFFDEQNAALDLVADSNVTSLMGNLVIAPGGGPVRPYVAAGAGLLRTRIGDALDLFDDITSNSFGFNAGGGLIVMFSDNAGFRGDVRYFRSIDDLDDEIEDELLELALGRLDFWRFTAGLTLRF